MKYDHDVVIPQPGQGIPASIRIVHGGNPSCWCVPIPLGLGSNCPAVTSRTSGKAIRARAVMRNADLPAEPVNGSVADDKEISVNFTRAKKFFHEKLNTR
tara:strand:- start:171924 stop:172223 length:300 start_codon:yes stop_codon:yes gene_type:complete